MSKELFADLRRLAEETRNKKLAEVRAEYSKTIADIAEMEQRLVGKPVIVRSKSKPKERLVDVVAAVIPSDRVVTVDDIQGLVRAHDNERDPNIQTLRMTLHRLVKEGAIKKVNHPQADRKVGYCLPSFEVEAVRPLTGWAEQVMQAADGPLTAVEIMVRMTETGHQMESEPQRAVRNLERALSKMESAQQTGNGWAILS